MLPLHQVIRPPVTQSFSMSSQVKNFMNYVVQLCSEIVAVVFVQLSFGIVGFVVVQLLPKRIVFGLLSKKV